MIQLHNMTTGEVVNVASALGYGGEWQRWGPDLPSGSPDHLVLVDQQWQLDATTLNTLLHARIDQEAGQFRGRFLTVAPGQEMTYLRKEEEARALLAGDAGAYAFLDAEARATGRTVEQVAGLVVAQADFWLPLGAAIEGLRMGAKMAVTAATTRADKEAAAVVDWEALLGE